MEENSCVPRHQLWKLMQQACKIPLSCQPDQGISKLIHLHFLKKHELIHQLICEFELADHHTWYIYLSLASHMKKKYNSPFPNRETSNANESQYPIKSLNWKVSPVEYKIGHFNYMHEDMVSHKNFGVERDYKCYSLKFCISYCFICVQ